MCITYSPDVHLVDYVPLMYIPQVYNTHIVTHAKSCIIIFMYVIRSALVFLTFGAHVYIHSTIHYAEPGVPTVTATVSRDTAVIVKLTPAQTFDLIEHCLVSIHPTTGSSATSGTEAVVEVSGNVLFIEGLLPGTEYSYRVAAMNEAGRSNFTKWVRFATTANGELNVVSRYCVELGGILEILIPYPEGREIELVLIVTAIILLRWNCCSGIDIH